MVLCVVCGVLCVVCGVWWKYQLEFYFVRIEGDIKYELEISNISQIFTPLKVEVDINMSWSQRGYRILSGVLLRGISNISWELGDWPSGGEIKVCSTNFQTRTSIYEYKQI